LFGRNGFNDKKRKRAEKGVKQHESEITNAGKESLRFKFLPAIPTCPAKPESHLIIDKDGSLQKSVDIPLENDLIRFVLGNGTN
jgi:hypothetical protein